MRAANLFLNLIKEQGVLNRVTRIVIDLYGSLALTGKGHRTDYAVMLGLESNLPENINPEISEQRFIEIIASNELNLDAAHAIDFDYDKDLVFHNTEVLPHHSNGLSFTALGDNNKLLLSKIYYSVGGGFVVDENSFNNPIQLTADKAASKPYKFHTAEELLTHCKNNNKSIAEILFANELVSRTEEEVRAGVLKIWHVMRDCIDRGIKNTGVLPGGLNIKRRANSLYNKLAEVKANNPEQDSDMNWLSLYAIAVNEENAAGGKVVTAPTNGAAGVIPSVLKYFTTQVNCTDAKIVDFLLTAAAIGMLYKQRASLSAAEVGCQGEVGVACSMAAAAYAAVLGGNIYQVENAAEIGMEHHLGLTCDPIGGLVQIPCIERNAAGAVQAVNAAQLALLGDGEHYVSLDKVIDTMRETGRDMMTKYKETSQGGLAVNLPEC
jgi:L-serine dehydratase